MLDDTGFGTRDRRGDWAPNEPINYPPVFKLPPQPAALAKWLFGYPGYLLPFNLIYALFAAGVWFFLTPPLETMAQLEPGWIAFILLRNAAITFIWFGAFHLRLYMQKAQGTRFKYNGKWLETDSPAFLFRNQTVDNLIWSFGSAVPIWTAFEVLMLWAYANGLIPFLDPREHPIAFVAILLVIPLFREVHFYCIHRLIHWPPLYHTVHKLHHANVNPGPWSGLAMHPVEHLLYFSGVLIHIIVPSHPIHVLNHLLHAGLSPAPGHAGFDKVVYGEESAVDTHSYAHYLHHKFFEVNYADGAVPLDKWFGTLHDGSKQADEAMMRRLRKRGGKKAGA